VLKKPQRKVITILPSLRKLLREITGCEKSNSSDRNVKKHRHFLECSNLLQENVENGRKKLKMN
jgi:hypothetical protein